MYPFSMYGRIVQIHRFSVTYEEETQWPDEDGVLETHTETRTEYWNTLEQAEAVAGRTGGAVAELDSSSYEWLDGIEVADVPDTYAEAVKIYEMGQAAYEAERAKPTPEETIAALETQLTDTQMALCELYESVVTE